MIDTTDLLKIALALQNIALSVDDETLKRIKPHLDTIEATVNEYAPTK
jgi:hypothetical protein